jgi:hypothetical protein
MQFVIHQAVLTGFRIDFFLGKPLELFVYLSLTFYLSGAVLFFFVLATSSYTNTVTSSLVSHTLVALLKYRKEDIFILHLYKTEPLIKLK